MGKQRNEMAQIFKRKRQKAQAQLRAVAAGELTSDKLNRLARKIQRKTNVVQAAKAAAAARPGSGA